MSAVSNALTRTARNAIGGNENAVDAVSFVGTGGLPSAYPVTDFASAAIATAALSIPMLAVGLSGLTLVFGACVMAAMAESGRLAYRAVEECASELNLFPLGTLVKPRRAALGTATANAATKAVGAIAPNPPAVE